MFLLQTFLMIASIYWISALISEAFMTSNQERALLPTFRVGLGFLFSVAYFCGAWLGMSIGQAWLLLGILIALIFTNRWLKLKNKNLLLLLRTFVTRYLKTFIFFLIGSIIFFAPLFISGNYGPFTESGGDITIYADTAKLLTTNQRTALGATTENATAIFHNFKEAILSDATPNTPANAINYNLINPPAAEYSIYRISCLLKHYRLLYIPTAAYAFVSNPTNYPVYFGIQAFIYSCILLCLWNFFRPLGRFPANLSIGIAISSYALVSTFYNMYALQTTSMLIAILFVCVLPVVRCLSWAGVRIYGPGILFLWLFYIHFLSVIAPLCIAFMLFSKRINLSFAQNVPKSSSVIEKVILLCLLIIGAFAAYYGASQSLELAGLLLNQFTGLGKGFEHVKGFLGGSSVGVFSMQGLTLLFGFLSQQHFQPFVLEIPVINVINHVGVVLGMLVVVLGAIIMWRIYRSPFKLQDKIKLYLLIYITLLATVSFQYYLGKPSYYTQSKAAQNVMPYLYLLMVLPFAVALLAMKEGMKIKRLTLAIAILLIGFLCALIPARVVYTIKLAYSLDRSMIIEPSFFAESQRLLAQDSNPYVLIEPRKSADLYLTTQPFFNHRQIITRDMAMLAYVNYDLANPQFKPVVGSDIIKNQDIPHLWFMRAFCENKFYPLTAQTCQWKAERIVEYKIPTLLMFADNYEKNYNQRIVSSHSTKREIFSILTNGSAMLFIPAGEGGKVDVLIQPQDESTYKQQLIEITERVKNNEFGKSVRLKTDGKNISLNYYFAKLSSPALYTISHLKGGYWLNVKLNNRDI